MIGCNVFVQYYYHWCKSPHEQLSHVQEMVGNKLPSLDILRPSAAVTPAPPGLSEFPPCSDTRTPWTTCERLPLVELFRRAESAETLGDARGLVETTGRTPGTEVGFGGWLKGSPCKVFPFTLVARQTRIHLPPKNAGETRSTEWVSRIVR